MPLPANACDAMQIVAAEKLRPLSRNLISPLHGFLAMSCKVLCSKVRQHAGARVPATLAAGTAPADAVLLHELLVKVPHVQIEVLLPVDPSNLLHLRHRHSMGRRLASSPLDQSILAELIVALPPTPHMPITDADDLGSLRHQVIFLAKACKITSCDFIARSTAAFE